MMTDLRTLLQQAAPVPERPLDMADIRRRARRRRGVVAWLAGLGALIGVALPVAGPALAPGGGGDSAARLQIVERSTTTIGDRPGPTEGKEGREQAGGLRRSGPAAVGTTSAGGTGLAFETGGSDVAPLAGGSSPASSADYPAAASCSVNNVDLEPGGQRRCRFTATVAAGASMTTTGPLSPPPGMRGEIIVTRDGQTTRYEVHDDVVRAGDVGTVYCAARVMEPGDLVEVVLTNANPSDGFETTLGAGEGWECWNTRGQS